MAAMQAMAASPQSKDDLFAGTEKFAQNAKSSTEVNLDKNMLGMAGKFVDDGEDKNGTDLAKKMDFVIVREYEYVKAGDYNLADVEEFRNRLDSSGWSHLVKERSATSSTDVCVKTDDDGKFSELVVIDAEPKELTFVHLKGHMSMEDLMKAGGKYGAPRKTNKDLKEKTKVK
jgi:hypothetical protein